MPLEAHQVGGEGIELGATSKVIGKTRQEVLARKKVKKAPK